PPRRWRWPAPGWAPARRASPTPSCAGWGSRTSRAGSRRSPPIPPRTPAATWPSSTPIPARRCARSAPRWPLTAAPGTGRLRGGRRGLLEGGSAAAAVSRAVRPGGAAVGALLDRGPSGGPWGGLAARCLSGDPGGRDLVRPGGVGVEDEGSQLAALGLAL